MASWDGSTLSKTELFTGSHRFTIIGYSCVEGIGSSAKVKSKTFFIGGYEWCLWYYPDGDNLQDEIDQYISIYLELVNTTDKVKALYRFEMLDSDGKPTVITKLKSPHVFYCSSAQGFKKFITKNNLKARGFLKEDTLTFQCTISIIKESRDTQPSLSSSCSSSATLIASNPANTSSTMEFLNGVHLYTIAGYSNSKDVGIGNSITSNAFKIGGHNWCLRYHPDGYEETDYAQYISFYLKLDDATDHDVKVLFDLALLDSNGKSSTMTPACGSVDIFNSTNKAWGINTFMNKHDLEASEFLIDDSFTVKCRIVIVKEPKAMPGN